VTPGQYEDLVERVARVFEHVQREMSKMDKRFGQRFESLHREIRDHNGTIDRLLVDHSQRIMVLEKKTGIRDG